MLLRVTAKIEPLRARELNQLRRFGERRRQRLVADDVDSSFEKRFRDGEVKVVRSDDDDRLDAVGTRRLAGRHFAIVRVAPVCRQTEIGSRRARIFRIRRQGAGFQLDQIVEPHGHAMHRADEGVAAAADHADAQPSALEPVDGGRVNHRLSL